jgi:hypothetical protein
MYNNKDLLCRDASFSKKLNEERNALLRETGGEFAYTRSTPDPPPEIRIANLEAGDLEAHHSSSFGIYHACH